MERYCRHIVTRRYVGPGARPDEYTTHASFDTLREAVEYVGYADADDQGTYVYQVYDAEHLHMGDMLANEECEHLVAAWRRFGRERWEAAA